MSPGGKRLLLCRIDDGFTLVETLIALAILAMVVASTFTIFKSSSSSWQKGETRSERYHNARVAIGKMSMEISQAVLSEDAKARFIGRREEVGFLSFVSTSSGIFELVEIEYWLDKGQKVIMRNEDINPDYDFSTQDHSDILAEGVSELEFSYYDGITWQDSWDSGVVGDGSGGEDAEGKLPQAVKVRLKVEDKKGKESEAFEVVTCLKTA
ncbi:MAG: prepilin-type N-terminal cleavage/methylation domain-containing protein [Candidatus Omnitrophica bacterium]|nr:prepilin-type N-terminal cleavage/methylation domain-containing protein [Candidatus Omnitrophota bacterium]